MKLAFFLASLLAPALLAASCNREIGTEEISVTLTPSELQCGYEAQTLQFNVDATASFESYTNDEWISGITPSFSDNPKGTVSFKVTENLSTSARTGGVLVRVGTTISKVKVVQEGHPKDESAITCPLDGYDLVWNDEFDTDAVNTGKWKFENWNKGWVNNERQYYVSGGEFDGVKTAFVEDGALHIVATKYEGHQKFNGSTDINGEVISARMNTKSSWKYGYFEASIWLPKGKGTWPAFWMMPNDQSLGWPACGEIDIMEEVGVDANKTSSSVHTKSYNHVMNTQKTASRTTAGAESGYHTYALEWTADYIQSYVDGKPLLKFANDGKGNNDTWPFNKAFYITLNLAWGGDWGGYAGVDESALPTTMKVDYVRVFQKK